MEVFVGEGRVQHGGGNDFRFAGKSPRHHPITRTPNTTLPREHARGMLHCERRGKGRKMNWQ